MNRFVLMLCLVVAPAVAFAHGGEDHGDKKEATPAADDNVRAAGGMGDLYEVLVKHTPSPVGKAVELKIFVADAKTNEPVPGAALELSFTAKGEIKTIARPTDSPGIYLASITFPAEGEFDVVASVSRGSDADLVTLGQLRVGLDARSDVAPHEHTLPRWPFVIVGVLLVLVGLFIVLRLRGLARLVCLVVIGLTSAAGWAHGGEDHGKKAKGTAPAAPAIGQAIHFAKEAQFLLGVRTEQIALREIEARVTVPGRIVPRTDRHAQIFPPVAGRILATNSRLPLVGVRVRRGQTLAVLVQSLSASESSQLVAERIRAETAVSQSKAALDQARRDWERVRALTGVVSQKELQKAELAVKVAEEDYQRSLRERSLYAGVGGPGGGKLTRFPLVSPIDGTLVDAPATIGEQVDPSKPLFTVVDTSVVWVEANVFADDLARVEEAREALVRVSAYPEVYFQGKLFNLSPMVDEQSRTAKAIFEVPNKDGKLRPGMFADVAIGAGGKQEILAVPETAIVELEGRKVVYVHTAPEEFVARDVHVGTRDGAYFAVKSGLATGDRVVTVGTYHLRAAGGGR